MVFSSLRYHRGLLAAIMVVIASYTVSCVIGRVGLAQDLAAETRQDFSSDPLRSHCSNSHLTASRDWSYRAAQNRLSRGG